MKRTAAVVIALAILVSATPSAFGAWSPGSGGSGRSTAISVDLPTTPNAAATGATTLHITWAAPGGASAAPSQYVVRRTAPTTATVCTVSGGTFACDDTGLTSGTTYTYTVEARLGTNWTSGQTAGFTGTPTALNFLVSVGAGNKTAGTAFTTTLTATTNGVTTDATYTGVHAITFSGPASSPSGQAPSYPATVTFVAGVGTATTTLYYVETATLSATDGTRTGTASITVVEGAATQLAYTASSISCAAGSVIVGNGGSFTSNVTIYDAWLNPVPQAAARTVSLTRSSVTGTLIPTSLTIPIAASQTSASFTFTLPNSNPPDTTITASSSGMTSAACIVKKN